MNANEVFEESVFDRIGFRGTRIAPATTLVIGTALLTQLMVLSSVAIVMGVAVATMCALFVQLVVLAVVAAVLERGVLDLEDLGTLMELSATILIAVVTLVLAFLGGNQQSAEKSNVFVTSSVAALKLT